MIVDAETLDLSNSIEALLDAVPEAEGEVKPELMESVCEIATTPCRDVGQAAAQLQALRSTVCQTAADRGLAIGSAGTHPFAMWEDQRIVARPRYRDLIAGLQFVARQELIFGVHVHVGIDDPDKAIYVANGMRLQIPLLLALSANSPFWRADATGLISTRTPIFRQFPRVGIPPVYRDWEAYQRRIGFMCDSGTIEDYTYLWYDIRPHPNLGTVEVRVMDAQTRVEHTVALAALVQALARRLSDDFESGRELPEIPHEIIDENKWIAARHGLAGELIDLPSNERVPAKALAKRLIDELAEHAADLNGSDAFDSLGDILTKGNGGSRQLVVWEANHDLREVMREIVEKTAGSD